jgi:SNF2 family DNA or RNA helicase
MLAEVVPLLSAEDWRKGAGRGQSRAEEAVLRLVLGEPGGGDVDAEAVRGLLKDGVELRGYQWEGVRWLAMLRRAGLNGALCDDMGLGKTLQVRAGS